MRVVNLILLNYNELCYYSLMANLDVYNGNCNARHDLSKDYVF